MAKDSIAKAALTITTDTAQLQKGLDDAKKRISGFNISLGDGLSFFTTGPLGAAIASVKSFADAIGEAGDRAEAIMNLSESFGTTAENMQAIQGAAKLAGVEIDSLTKALRAVGELIGEAELGTAEATKKLSLVGLKTGDIAGRDPVEVLTTILDKMQQLGTAGQQLKVASDIFGGKNSLQALTLMRAELGKTTQELKNMGAVTKTETLQTLDQAADKFSVLTMRVRAFKDEVLATLVKPVVGATTSDFSEDKLSARLTELYEKYSELRKIADASPETIAKAGFSQSWADAKVSELIKVEGQIAVVETRLKNVRMEKYVEGLDRSEAITDALNESVQRLTKSMFDLEMAIFEKQLKESEQFVTADPLNKMATGLDQLEWRFQAGALSVDDYASSLIGMITQLEKADKAASAIQLPGAVMAGSAEVTAARQRGIAESRFGATGDEGNAQLKEMKDKLEAMRTSSKNQEALLGKIEKSVQTLQGLKGI